MTLEFYKLIDQIKLLILLVRKIEIQISNKIILFFIPITQHKLYHFIGLLIINFELINITWNKLKDQNKYKRPNTNKTYKLNCPKLPQIIASSALKFKKNIDFDLIPLESQITTNSSIMKTSQAFSMQRTGTMPVSLPKITKLNIRESRYNQINLTARQSLQKSNANFHLKNNSPKNRSSMYIHTSRARHSQSFMMPKQPYTARVEQQVIEQQQYPYIQTTGIQKQQHRLKQLLKQFNEETVSILQKYIIDKPIRKQYVKKKPQVQIIHSVREREKENSSQMILLMKKEIEKLQSRCEDLKYLSKEEFEQKIKQVKQEKARLIAQNKEISKSITLNGLQMVRGKQSQVRKLEYDQLLVGEKKQRLKAQSQSVIKQLHQLQQKTKQLTAQINTYENTESYSTKVQEQMQTKLSQNRLYSEYRQRQRQLQHLQTISQSNNYQLKHKYFQKLKLLEETASLNEELTDREVKMLAKIQNAQLMIKELENKHSRFLMLSKPFQNNNNSNNNKVNTERSMLTNKLKNQVGSGLKIRNNSNDKNQQCQQQQQQPQNKNKIQFN